MEKTKKISLSKLTEAVESLSEVDESYEDYFELLGILIDDIVDLYKAKDSKSFTKQKSDARQTLKEVRKRLNNATFKNIKKTAFLK